MKIITYLPQHFMAIFRKSHVSSLALDSLSPLVYW